MVPVAFEAAFPHAYEVEILDSVPDTAWTFERGGSTERGELIVGVRTETGDRWSGAARAGAPSVRSALSGCFSTPAATSLLLVSRGDAFLVDVLEPGEFHVVDTGGPVVLVRPLVDHGLLLLGSPWIITAIDEGGRRWQTRRLSIDGIRLDEVDEVRLAGVADPDDDEPRDFVVDLRSGEHEGGVPFA